jgi:hypothetical protein
MPVFLFRAASTGHIQDRCGEIDDIQGGGASESNQSHQVYQFDLISLTTEVGDHTTFGSLAGKAHTGWRVANCSFVYLIHKSKVIVCDLFAV